MSVAKEAVEQYKEQLEESISRSRVEALNEKGYESRVVYAGKCLDWIKTFLDDAEKVIFEEGIDETVVSILMDQIVLGITKEEIEVKKLLRGIGKLFAWLGIPKYAIYPIIADVIERMKDINYVDGDLSEEKINDKLFRMDGLYEVGELVVNVLMAKEDMPYYCSQGIPLVIDAKRFKILIDKYVIEEIEARNIEDLQAQNEFVLDIFHTLMLVGSDGGFSMDILYSKHYFDKFEVLFGKPTQIFTKTRLIDKDLGVQLQIEELKRQRELVNRLIELNKEEEELNTKMLEFLEEKIIILRELSLLKMPRDDVSNRNIGHVFDGYYMNGKFYCYPNYDKKIYIKVK